MILYNDIELDLPEGEVTPLSKQVNDVAQLDAFKSDFVREFRVKRTRAMEALFENASLINSETSLPYTALEVKVIYLGLEVVPKGKMAINRVDENYYYCAIYSGAKNLFDSLKEIKLTSLDLNPTTSPPTTLVHDWTGLNARDSILNDLDYQYLLADYSDDGQLITDADPLVFQAAELRPCIRLSRLVDDILADYTVVNDIATDTLYLKMFVPISTIKTNKEAVKNYLVNYQTIGLDTTVIRLNEDYVIYDPLGMINTSNEYVARVTGKHYFQVAFAIAFTSITDVEAKVGGSQVATSYAWDLINGFLLEVDLTIGDEVSFYSVGGNIPSGALIVFRCFDIEPTVIGLTSEVNPSFYLPAISQGDLIKAVCNIFGLVPEYDAITETVKLWSINNLYDNRYKSRDWSEYLSLDNEQLSFRLEYAKENNLKWKDDNDVGLSNGNASIIVNDQNLAKEKDLFTLPFAFCDEVTHQSEPMARIGWFEAVEGTTEYKEKDSITPRLVTREAMATACNIVDGVSTYSLTDSQAYAARSFFLDLNVSLNYNNAIVKMLQKSKVLTAKFNLPVTEVVDLDHSVPIYLKQYSEYFFVKKVSNYIPERICEVELIRLP